MYICVCVYEVMCVGDCVCVGEGGWCMYTACSVHVHES